MGIDYELTPVNVLLLVLTKKEGKKVNFPKKL